MRILLTSLVLNSSPGVPSPGSPRFHLALCCVFFNMLIGVQGFQSHGGRKLFDALDRLAFLHEFDITAQESSELATAIYFRNQYSGEIDMSASSLEDDSTPPFVVGGNLHCASDTNKP